MSKLQHFLESLEAESPFVDVVDIPDEVKDAMRWCAARSIRKIIEEREKMITWIENECDRVRFCVSCVGRLSSLCYQCSKESWRLR